MYQAIGLPASLHNETDVFGADRMEGLNHEPRGMFEPLRVGLKSIKRVCGI